MDEEHFNMEVRKFLKKVGVTSQREIEKAVPPINSIIQSRPKQERRWLHLRPHHLFFSRGNSKAIPGNSVQIRFAVHQANGKAW